MAYIVESRITRGPLKKEVLETWGGVFFGLLGEPDGNQVLFLRRAFGFGTFCGMWPAGKFDSMRDIPFRGESPQARGAKAPAQYLVSEANFLLGALRARKVI